MIIDNDALFSINLITVSSADLLKKVSYQLCFNKHQIAHQYMLPESTPLLAVCIVEPHFRDRDVGL